LSLASFCCTSLVFLQHNFLNNQFSPNTPRTLNFAHSNIARLLILFPHFVSSCPRTPMKTDSFCHHSLTL
jgi:hypothetical protein